MCNRHLLPVPTRSSHSSSLGAFPIVQKIGTIPYKLELPSEASIHIVFHVSQLKKAVGSKIQVTSWSQQLSEYQIPEKILHKRLITHGMHTMVQVLIEWSASLESLSMWEDMEALKQRFPMVPAWGQATSFGGGNVTEASPATELAPGVRMKGVG
jgi:hypothetical protein